MTPTKSKKNTTVAVRVPAVLINQIRALAERESENPSVVVRGRSAAVSAGTAGGRSRGGVMIRRNSEQAAHILLESKSSIRGTRDQRRSPARCPDRRPRRIHPHARNRRPDEYVEAQAKPIPVVHRRRA